jgi:hypothetical protein
VRRKAMKRRTIALSILGLLLAAGAGWAASNREDLRHFPPIISSYYAKELCSCLYVVGQTETYCHSVVRQYVPISSFQIDASSRTVTVSGLGQTNRARFVDDRYGCVLEGTD